MTLWAKTWAGLKSRPCYSNKLANFNIGLNTRHQNVANSMAGPWSERKVSLGRRFRSQRGQSLPGESRRELLVPAILPGRGKSLLLDTFSQVCYVSGNLHIRGGG
jgi:hypothetical protein